ncbi:DEAD/DEAH box helicase [Myceligenerans xiligouense]|uniref:ATP-dependent RNA helicase DeaD n=1 Tax=Myceligenerans xiligouense TaxID=253184 RepID=A0A3N4ZKW3_9MICO|nr:DEAD/DEAH box helicase [Myceligenerans xiligouense]RPF21595.1 ATP-dependent RNA helicase DeaD [Myceligenerans xiligouense]
MPVAALTTPAPETPAEPATEPATEPTATEPAATEPTATAPAEPEQRFDDLPLPAALLDASRDLGFSTPSDIQAAAIPPLLNGRDITGVAQTGTGKTAAFGLPLLAAVDPQADVTRGHVQALVLAPTRELAMQVADAIESFATHLPGVRVLPVYGGAPYVPQQRALRDGVHVVVGTPGRVMDHMERGSLVLDDVKFLVLDEADEMLRMGFAEDVEKIFSTAPRERQVALFSATMPPAIRKVADQHLNDPVEIAVTRQSSTVTSVRQTYAVVPFRHKTSSLVRVLATSDADAAIVFTRTRGAAEDVGSALLERGISAATISGDVAQKDREKIVERLRSGALDVLVATDVAARGLDVDRIGLVVNFDLPREPEAYVHRIGRTGRAGRTGKALTFVTPNERGLLRRIERTVRTRLEEADIPSPRDVSAHKFADLLKQVPARREAGRLDLYAGMLRTYLGGLTTAAGDTTAEPAADATPGTTETTETTADDTTTPAVSRPAPAGADEEIIQIAAALAAMAVGDDGPRLRAEQEEYEREQAQARSATTRRVTHDAARHDRSGERTGYRDRPGRGPRDHGRSGTRYRLAVGHTHGVNPGGIVGALTNEGGLTGSDVGKIDIFGSFSLVDISASLDEPTMDRLGRARVAGRALRIQVDRGAPARRSSSDDERRGGFSRRENDQDRGPRPHRARR